MSLVSPKLYQNNFPVKEWIFGFLYLLLGCYGMTGYLELYSVNFIIGVVAIPMMFMPAGAQKNVQRFFYLAIIFALTGIIIPVKTAVYMTLCCALLFLYERRSGSVTMLPLVTLLLMSPFCQNFAKIFSFPVRLWLTDTAGFIFKLLGLNNSISGNIISLDKDDFSVDPACMGLNMLVTSLLCCVIMIGIFQKREQKKIKLKWILLCLLVAISLNIIANLLRIILLVYFKILPENPMHGICGLICLGVYVILPVSFFVKFMVRKKGVTIGRLLTDTVEDRIVPVRLYLIVLLLLLLVCWRVKSRKYQPATGTLPSVAGYQVSRYDSEVLKMENNNALIYIKSLKGFIYTEHNPLICWTGSGYVFDSISEHTIADIKFFTGIINNGQEKLFTAWWYDNGTNGTTSQWVWRGQMMKGSAPYYIINITAGSKATLYSEINKLLLVKSVLMGLNSSAGKGFP